MAGDASPPIVSCPLVNGKCSKEDAEGRVGDDEMVARLLHNDDMEDGEIAARFLPVSQILAGGWSFIRHRMASAGRLKAIAKKELPRGPEGYDYYVVIKAGQIRSIADAQTDDAESVLGVIWDGKDGRAAYEEHVSVENCALANKKHADKALRRIRRKLLFGMQMRPLA